MNKGELVDAVAEKAGVTKGVAAETVNAVLDSITNTLKEKGTVNLIGFGSFSVKKRAARTGVNPKTGERIEIPEALLPIFKAGKSLKEAVQE